MPITDCIHTPLNHRTQLQQFRTGVPGALLKTPRCAMGRTRNCRKTPRGSASRRGAFEGTDDDDTETTSTSNPFLTIAINEVAAKSGVPKNKMRSFLSLIVAIIFWSSFGSFSNIMFNKTANFL